VQDIITVIVHHNAVDHACYLPATYLRLPIKRLARNDDKGYNNKMPSYHMSPVYQNRTEGGEEGEESGKRGGQKVGEGVGVLVPDRQFIKRIWG
jgi:hypothetical protein